MKVNLFMYGDDLAFSFKKEDVKTAEDRKVICTMIDHLYHMHCVETWTNGEKLDEILSLSPDDEVTLTVLQHDRGARLVGITNIRSES